MLLFKMAEGRQAQYFVTAAVSVASMVSGLSLGWPTPVIPKFHNNETSLDITDDEISWVAAMSAPGFMTGSLATSFVSDRFGRRIDILSSALPIITGTVLILSTSKAWCLYITRFLWGAGNGMVTTVSAMYIAEISDKEIRGHNTSSIRYMRSFGSFLIMAVGPFISYNAINYMLLILPVCYFICCCFVPESPYYLLKEEKVNAARASLVKLSGNKDKEAIDNRLSALGKDVKKETLRSGSIKELFTGKRYRRALIITIGLKITQMMSGAIAIQQYFGRIVQETNTNVDISTMLIIFGAMKFIVGIFASAIVDKVGRRPLLFCSYLSSGITLTVVGAYYLIPLSSNPCYSCIPFTGIILFNVLSILGFETLVFVITGEIFPLNVKSVALSFQNILGGSLNFFAVKSFQGLKDIAGLTGVFWFYAISSLLGAVFTYFMVLETKGKSLREIQIELQGDMYDEDDVKMQNVIVNKDS